MPEPGAKNGISVKEAVEVIFTCYITWYITCYITWYGWQLGVLPEMDREAPGLFTASERIIQDFAREKKVNATFIKDLIQKVLHHPDFDPDDVDHDMHERLMAAIEEGDPVSYTHLTLPTNREV